MDSVMISLMICITTGPFSKVFYSRLELSSYPLYPFLPSGSHPGGLHLDETQKAEKYQHSQLSERGFTVKRFFTVLHPC